MTPVNRDNTGGLPGNRERAAEIFEEYGDFIKTIIGYRVPNKADADDVFQDFFLLLLAKPVPPETSNIKAYLYRMIANHVTDGRRTTAAYARQMRTYAEWFGEPVAQRRPEAALTDAEELNKMFKLIKDQLTPVEAKATLLRLRHDYDIPEVARRMGVDKKTVTRYISIGLAKLRWFLRRNRGDKR